ncbi:MAG: FAD-dependent oxidoreductase [Deltaproteobacteria bacterium]|nr:FAD-dependent oxidoreductase [Deltaproteobacteria bacterium]
MRTAHNESHDVWDSIVIGAGLAGSAAAYHLAQRGRRVLLLEREATIHPKVCGEVIRAEALPYLLAMDVDVAALGAQQLTRARCLAGSARTTLLFPTPAYGLSRVTLDTACSARAMAVGTTLHLGETVHAIAQTDGAYDITTSHDTYRGRSIILATGKHDLRSVQTRATRHSLRGAVGIKWHCQATHAAVAELGNTVWMLAFPGGYAGLCRVGATTVNLCGSVTPAWLARHGRQPHQLRAFLHDTFPIARPLLDGLTSEDTQPLVIAGIPYGFFRPAASLTHDGAYAVGDQVATMPSVVGIGMTVALATGTLAAIDLDATLRGQPRRYEDQLHRLLARARRAALFTHAMMTSAAAPYGVRLCRWLPPLGHGVLHASRVPSAGVVFARQG